MITYTCTHTNNKVVTTRLPTINPDMMNNLTGRGNKFSVLQTWATFVSRKASAWSRLMVHWLILTNEPPRSMRSFDIRLTSATAPLASVAGITTVEETDNLLLLLVLTADSGEPSHYHKIINKYNK
jgi:hypothetical protein